MASPERKAAPIEARSLDTNPGRERDFGMPLRTSATRDTDHTTSRASTQSTQRPCPCQRQTEGPTGTPYRRVARAHSWLDKPRIAPYHAAIRPPRIECSPFLYAPLMN